MCYKASDKVNDDGRRCKKKDGSGVLKPGARELQRE